MNKLFYIITLLVLGGNACLKAQDIHFSQYSATQPYINPALTGFFDGDYRIMLNGRLQSKGSDAPYQTIGGAADFSLFKNKLDDDYFGVGVVFYNDNAGFLDLVTNQMQLNLAYSLGFGNRTKHFIALGFNGGVIQKTLDATNLIFPTIDEKDLFAGATNGFTFDMGFGLNYQFFLNKRFNAFAGYSMAHVLEPIDNVINASQSKIYMKHSMQFAAKIKAAEMVNIIPNALYHMQAGHRQLNAGLNAQFLVGNYEEDRVSFTAGTYGRFTNNTIAGLIFLAKMELKGFQLGLSYDANLSEYGSAPGGGANAFEISIGYIGITSFVPSSRLKCPDMKSF